MEYLKGETLEARLRRGPLGMEEVFRCGIELASALTHAHSRGRIHRDFKPANIMLTKAGAKVLDFGLARAVAVSGAKCHNGHRDTHGAGYGSGHLSLYGA